MRKLIAEIAALPDARLRAAAEGLTRTTEAVLSEQGRDAEAGQALATAYLDAVGWVLGGALLARAAAADGAAYGAVADFYLRRLLPRAGARFAEIEGAMAA
ncbi:MAG: acyl-CoA dehydrogenase C-terminal domain-containing protein [Acetobacteraceae bacterium]|nr:acyl-CoA dehydrogenase C-terminal domain-containing protein [Acetobacteraceae bacterium]